MKTLVEFRSTSFPPYEGEEEQINPGVWGKRLAEYLVEEMRKQGISAEKMNSEDWGWYIPIKNDDFRLAICCGHNGGDDDRFVCFIDPWKPQIRRWFKKVDTTKPIGHLVEALGKILSSHSDIKEICWSENQ